ncbi:hypothetical protein [Pseudomonas sp. NPDC007930]|uniref:hypothetical protein n=1 Tax=Pseudomonas sp. NPDC007930 TaxID=3364417 RepID=UPI0036EEB2F0
MLEQDFTAEIICTTPEIGGSVALSNTIGIDQFLNPFNTLLEGWAHLTTTSAQSFSVIMRFAFKYRESQPERVLYAINGTGDVNLFRFGSLGYGNDGQVALYDFSILNDAVNYFVPRPLQPSTVSDWKLQPLAEWDGTPEGAEQVDFYLRNDAGERIGLQPVILPGGQRMLGLNTAEGEPLTFRFKGIQAG